MAKRALGRGLGELLPGQKAGKTVPTGVQRPSKDPADLGPGLRALVSNGNGHHGGLLPNGSHRGTARRHRVVLSLVLADLVLAGLTLFWAQRAEVRFDAATTAATVLGILFAGWLGCLAAWVHFRGS